MLTFKKICFYICIILLIMSLYNDFTKASYSIHNNRIESVGSDITEIHAIRVVPLRVDRGETILSVSERINGKALESKDIEQIIADFKLVNQDVNIHELLDHIDYYFPIYD